MECRSRRPDSPDIIPLWILDEYYGSATPLTSNGAPSPSAGVPTSVSDSIPSAPIRTGCELVCRVCKPESI